MRYRTVLLLVSPIMLAACGASHETRSLLCLGFCSEQRVEHKAPPEVKPPPKEKEKSSD